MRHSDQHAKIWLAEVQRDRQNQNNMATFTVVMRCLTKGQAYNLHRCLQQSQPDLRNVTDLLCSGIGSQLLFRPANFSTDRKCFSRCSRSASSSLYSCSYRSRSRSTSVTSTSTSLLPSLRNGHNVDLCHQLPNQHLLNFFISRTLSTSPSDRPASTQTSADSSSDKKEHQKGSDEKSEEPKKESWWRGKNSWRLGLIFLGGTFITWGIGLVNIWGE